MRARFPSVSGVRALRVTMLWGTFAVAGCSVAYDATLAANEGLAGQGGSSGASGTGGRAGIAGAAGLSGAAGAAGRGGAGQGGTPGGASGTAGSAAAGTAGASGAPIKTKCAGGKGEECNDGNPCTLDSCDKGICVFSTVLPGTPCDTDADKCNGVGTCTGATCVVNPKSAIDPEDADKCTDDLCDPMTGIVTHPPSVKPSDSTVCTKAVCDPATGGKVVIDLTNDGNACTLDACSLETGPTHTAIQVGDGDPCTVDSCDPITGVKHVSICDGCKNDSQCNDGNPCTVDVCVDGGMCSHAVSAGAPCDTDGTLCNGTSICGANGVCQPVPPTVPTDDKNACTQDLCDPASGNITHPAISVEDGNVCTVDSCDPETGSITHTSIPECIACSKAADCPSGPCFTSSCTLGPGGGVCSVGFVAQGTNCSDGMTCNGAERCNGNGVCVAGQAPPVDDGNACTIDSCVEPTGPVHEPTEACKACNVDADCDVPSNVCLLRTCTSGRCTTRSASTGTKCSNGLKCDGMETCEAGVCRPGAAPDCGVPECSGTNYATPKCSESSPSSSGCGFQVQSCGAQNLVCSVASGGCVPCDDAAKVCETGRVCNLSGPEPHLCCTPQSAVVSCGSRICGTVVDNCGQVVSCGTCTQPGSECSADQKSCVF